MMIQTNKRAKQVPLFLLLKKDRKKDKEMIENISAVCRHI